MKKLCTENAPKAIGPYSQGCMTDGLLFCSGQIAIDPKTNVFVGGGIAEQTERVCKNIIALLEAAGLSADNVVKTTCYLTEAEDFAAFNEVYSSTFSSLPARSCVFVKALPKGALVEIEVVAEIQNKS